MAADVRTTKQVTITLADEDIMYMMDALNLYAGSGSIWAHRLAGVINESIKAA